MDKYHTPQAVIDALQTVGAYLREHGYAECVVAPTGGAAFHLTRKSDELLRAWAADRARFRTVLTTIGGTLYQRGPGAKWDTDLLSFVRNERDALDDA